MSEQTKMLRIPGTQTDVPAVQVAKQQTRADNAWLGEYITVRLTAELIGIRVHVGAGEGASTDQRLASGAGLQGRWFAIGDYVQTREEYVRTHALPAGFTEIALCTFRPGTLLNVGLCAPLFDKDGGGEQAEFLEGPAPLLQPLHAYWSSQAGHA